jgi:hypothetical protein
MLWKMNNVLVHWVLWKTNLGICWQHIWMLSFRCLFKGSIFFKVFLIIKLLMNGRLPIVDMQLMFNLFWYWETTFNFAIGSMGNGYVAIFACVSFVCHLLQIFEVFISILKSYWACSLVYGGFCFYDLGHFAFNTIKLYIRYFKLQCWRFGLDILATRFESLFWRLRKLFSINLVVCVLH